MHYKHKQSDKAFTATPEKYPQKRFSDKPCRACKTVFKPVGPSHLYCSKDCRDEGFNKKLIERTYDLSYEDYKKMVHSHKGACGICGGEGFLMSPEHKAKLVIDHCHVTGTVRGLLCHNCNRALGLLKDSVSSLKNAIKYLEGATTIP